MRWLREKDGNVQSTSDQAKEHTLVQHFKKQERKQKENNNAYEDATEAESAKLFRDINNLRNTEVKKQNLLMKEFSRVDFPADFGPRTRQRKTFLSVLRFFRSTDLFRVIVRAEAGLPTYPTYIIYFKLWSGSSNVISAHCKNNTTKNLKDQQLEPELTILDKLQSNMYAGRQQKYTRQCGNINVKSGGKNDR